METPSTESPSPPSPVPPESQALSVVEPPPSPFAAGLAAARARLLADPEVGEVAATGADLTPATLLAAYRLGLFPMGLGPGGAQPLGWWCPDPRGILPLNALRVSRSLRRSCRRLTVTVDAAFDAVVTGCAAPSRPGRWITPAVAAAYSHLHRLGWAHSIETWLDGALVGGLYGVGIGGLFAGESMFSTVTDASKVALVALVDVLAADAGESRLLDVQWRTAHLASLGVQEITRRDYLARLPAALAAPPPERWNRRA